MSARRMPIPAQNLKRKLLKERFSRKIYEDKLQRWYKTTEALH